MTGFWIFGWSVALLAGAAQEAAAFAQGASARQPSLQDGLPTVAAEPAKLVPLKKRPAFAQGASAAALR